MFGKLWYESKTIWLGALQVLASVLTYMAGLPLIAAYPEIASGLLAISGIIIIILRFLTEKPIVSDKPNTSYGEH